MFNLFSRRRKKNEEEIQSLKDQHIQTAKKAQSVIAEANKRLTNGFAIKVYYSMHHEGKK